MRISDWSSDVCSSDLEAGGHHGRPQGHSPGPRPHREQHLRRRQAARDQPPDALRPLQAIRTPAMTKAQHILTALLLATTACSNASDISGAYERGIAAPAAGQPRTARVEFMTVIKAAPHTGTARVLTDRKIGR